MKSRILMYALLPLLLINSANAAVIYGTVYDFSLDRVNNARIEINTTPRQHMITINGSYYFNAGNGVYTIKAKLMEKKEMIAFVQENITIRQDGSYVLDLILFPSEENLDEDIEFNNNIFDSKNYNFTWVGVIFIVLGALVYLKIKNKKIKTAATAEEVPVHGKEFDDENLNRLMSIIKKEDGRATQKDIRKQLPLSEAKISLMIAELEHKGIIEKIKKGRGNIIILKKK